MVANSWPTTGLRRRAGGWTEVMFAEAEHQWNPRGLGGHSAGQRVGNPVGTVHEFPGQVLAKDIYTVINTFNSF